MNEKDLIEKIKNRDERAFKTFVDSYNNLVFRAVMSFGISKVDAEDLSQEVFIEVYRNANKFRNESEISTWLYRIAINKTLNFIKKRKKTLWRRNEDTVFLVNDICMAEESSETKYVNEEQRKKLYGSIQKLSKNQRIAFTLNKIENLSYKEISEIMDISVSSVESLIHRAKKNLQTLLLSYFK